MADIGKVTESPSREVSPMATERDTGREPVGGDAAGVEPSITVPLAVRPQAPESAALAPGDIALYRELLPSWREHEGEHVLIHGGAVHGFYPTRRHARREGFRRFGAVAFLVKR